MRMLQIWKVLKRVDYLNGKLIVQSNNGTLIIVEIPRGDLLWYRLS